MILFTVLGEPQGKGRPRFGRVASGRTVTYTPDKTALYESLIVTEYRRQAGDVRFPDGQPLSMAVVAYYGIPSGTSKKRRADMMAGNILPAKKPDADNVLKVVADALNGVAYKDDAQIAQALVLKQYSDVPRIDVTIREVGQ